MSVAFESFLNWFVDSIPGFLTSQPIIYFVVMALLCYVTKIFITLIRGGV